MSSFSFKNVVFYIQVLVNLICVRNFGKFILISLIFFVNLTMESSDSINEEKNCIQKLLERQDSQFRALTVALKYSLNNLVSALDKSIDKLSKSTDKK